MATYYVDQKNGNDANSGLTKALAWKTLDKVYTTAVSYDTIFLWGGDFGGFYTNPLSKYFRFIGHNNVVIRGTQSNFCVRIPVSTFGVPTGGDNLKYDGMSIGTITFFASGLNGWMYENYNIKNANVHNFSSSGQSLYLYKGVLNTVKISGYAPQGILYSYRITYRNVTSNNSSHITFTILNPLHFLYNIIYGSSIYLSTSNNLLYCGFLNSQFKFTAAAAFAYCKTAAELRAKRDLDLSVTTPSDWYNTCTFIDHTVYDEYDVFNDPANDDFTLKAEIATGVINPFAIGTYELTELGAFGVALKWTPADFTPDANGSVTGGLHKVSGVYSIFTGVAKAFAVARQIKRCPAFGQLFDRDQIILCAEDPDNFPYERATTGEFAFSATLSSGDLDTAAGVSVPYLKFLIGEPMFYVDNAGTLVGNGDSTYLGLVNSAGGGTGSLPAIKVVAKSLKPRLTIYDEI